MNKIFSDLNNKQIEAVKTINGPVLVISGPGSGKTRCLTHRIAHLIYIGVRPQNILAITFTNKAAQEMRERISGILGHSNPSTTLRTSSSTNSRQLRAMPLIGTFHSICLKILRREILTLGYSPNFTILDEDDQTSLVKRIMTEIEIDTKRHAPRMTLSKISKLKTNLITPEEYEAKDFFERLVKQIYTNYQSELKRINSLDFDDLIVLTVKIFQQKPERLEKYQNFWPYILVDEYQDTSFDQYMFIKLLAQKNKNLFVIGDDAQSIYAFRDADIRNILNFKKDYPNASIIFLEQNYRSTKAILAAAQNIISNNQNQVPKNLWTENNDGGKILIKETLNERDEADFLVDKIDQLLEEKYSIKDFTILYRTHAQSRAIEEALISRGWPYQIVGGIKFYDRKEIKDVLAYLKFLNNPLDRVSFERVYNIPPRGIGKSMFEKIINTDESNLIKAIIIAPFVTTGTTRGAIVMRGFGKLLKELSDIARKEKLTNTIKSIVKKTGYEGYLKNLSLSKNEAYENFEERMENIKELLTVAKKYSNLPGKGGIKKFLEEIALLQETDSARTKKSGESHDQITLMTIHSSKGLEFPVVFIVGMEEGLFPHSRSILDPSELEEERRLCYVAITRAKEKLILSYARYRNMFGSLQVNLPSRFIGEIPGDLVKVETSLENYLNEKMVEY